MSAATPPQFRLPPVTECISQDMCLGFGKKVHTPAKICQQCLLRHDPQQLKTMAGDNANALAIISEEISRKQTSKKNIESHGKFLCAFEDPDYLDCPWRGRDLNLRGTRTNCSVVRYKGMACRRCWRRSLQNIGIIQYFTPTRICHEQLDRIEPQERSQESVDDSDDPDDSDEDPKGYNGIES